MNDQPCTRQPMVLADGSDDIERNLDVVLKYADPDLFAWRARVRRFLAEHDDGPLREVYIWTSGELDNRARRAWQRGGA